MIQNGGHRSDGSGLVSGWGWCYPTSSKLPAVVVDGWPACRDRNGLQPPGSSYVSDKGLY